MLKNSPGLSSYRGFGVPSSGTISRGTFYRGENPTDYSKRMLKERGDPLAEFSGIHPEKIIGKQKPTKEQALRFVSGGSPIGDSIVSGAKNKIVGFDRNIKPKPNNLKSLIGNLSSNIFSTSSVSNIFNTTEKEKTPEKKEKGFKPFGGFFDRIKEALAFITFFGSKKNLDRIRENIDNLKTTFSETFEVAKALRKVILKIIEQISGLSGGGGGGALIGAIMSALGGLVGGLVPGLGGKRPPNIAGPAMKQEGNLISKIPKILTSGGGGISKLLLGGAAALGTGAAISGLSQPDNSENIQPGYTTPEVPGNVLDKFNSILDRFDKVIESLLKGKGSGSQKPSGSSGGSKSSGGAPPGGAPPGGAPPGDTPPGGSAQTQQILKNDPEFTTSINELAKAKGYDASDLLAMIGSETGGTFDPKIKNPDSEATGLFQITRESGVAERLGYKSFDEFSKSAQKMTRAEQVRKIGTEYFKNAPNNLKGGQLYAQLFLPGRFNPKSGDNQVLTRSGEDYYKGNKGLDVNKDGKITVSDLNVQIGNIKKQYGINPGQPSTAQAPGQVPTPNQTPAPNQAPQTPAPKPAPGQAPTTKPTPNQAPQTPAPKPAPGQAPQTPAPKPAPGQQSIQVIPLGQQQSQVQPAPSGGGGKISTPPSPKQNGPTAPFLPSSNPNNFLTLYSRMVYNIVDG